LAGNATGGVSLVARSTSSSDTAQLWYVTENGNGYSIMNVKYKTYLYAQNQNGTRTCSLSGTVAQTWMFLDYDVPTEVSTLSSLANPNLYLKNASGLNYTQGRTVYISIGTDNRGTSTQTTADVVGDKCGFRIVPLEDSSYLIMPISSGNGRHRAIAKHSESNDVMLLDYKLGSISNPNLHIDVQANVPTELAVEIVDLSIILTNLLDNALTAIANVNGDCQLSVRISYQKGMLLIHVSNSYNGDVQYENGVLVTTKEEKEEHGRGLQNVRKAVEKYQGILRLKHDADTFTAEVILYVT
jgi:hypothetical protein